MKSTYITDMRLFNQLLSHTPYNSASDIVSWLGAVQAQDYVQAKYAIAIRSKTLTDQDIENQFNRGEILRTHIFRPTWHFVHPDDICWMLNLTADRVKAFNGYYYKRTGLSKQIFDISSLYIAKALSGKKALTRHELNKILIDRKIPTQDLGLSYIIMQAELGGLIVSGPRKGKQFTYMLLSERVKATKIYSRDESIQRLLRRFLQSHGPAQIKDFSWWSGLTISEGKRGIALLGNDVLNAEFDSRQYFYLSSSIQTNYKPVETLLLPGFDEYFIAYTDRTLILDKRYGNQLNAGGGMVRGAITIKGRMIGGWQRKKVGNKIFVHIELFEDTADYVKNEVIQRVKEYERFIGIPVEIIYK